MMDTGMMREVMVSEDVAEVDEEDAEQREEEEDSKPSLAWTTPRRRFKGRMPPSRKPRQCWQR